MAPRLLSTIAFISALMTGACSGAIDPGPRDRGDPNLGAGAPVGAGAGAAAPPGAADPADAIDPTGGALNLAGSPTYFRVVRLTNTQLTRSVQAILGLHAPPAHAETFQDAVSGTTDFTNNELVLDIDSRGWSDYQLAAEALAAEVAGDGALLAQLYSGTDAPGFIATVGRRAYRRPLTPDEVAGYQTLFDLGSSMSGSWSPFAKGAAVVLEAMLQSPHFLYRTELGEVGAPLTGYEMAAKLSLWLRNTTPDDALLDAAERGELDTAAGAAAIAQQMLDEPAALDVMREFHGQLLHMKRFSELSKVGVPSYDEAINPELAEASYLFFDRIFSQGLGLQEVFLSTTGFVSPRMAPFYGLPAQGAGFAEHDLGGGRLGYFTQLPFLMLYAHNDGPDAIHRGVSMSLDVLCAPLGPPAAVIPPLPTPRPGQTNRQRVDEHTSGCGGACHNDMINPLGFAFEHFDGMGQYREMEQNGAELLPIDSSGSFEFIDGEKSWQDATELMQVLAADPQTHLCFSKKLASFGLQRDVVADDMAMLSELSSTSRTGSLKQLVLALVQQDAFRIRAGGAP
ncbi:MAG: DUF1592 domain-containing protein [Myxococcales bacterium]|nr:DUF1592 domain-containing protein [Myxococcales bacterium]